MQKLNLFGDLCSATGKFILGTGLLSYWKFIVILILNFYSCIKVVTFICTSFICDQPNPLFCSICLHQVWDLDTLEAVMTLNGHTDAPMSLLCWDQYLLSCSLDNTIKVWIMTEEGNLEVAYTHNEDHVC